MYTVSYRTLKAEHSFGITFGTITAFYICIIFPLQVRYYILKSRRQKLQRVRRSQTVNNQFSTSTTSRTVTDSNQTNNSIDGISSEQSQHHLIIGTVHTAPGITESYSDIEVSAARHLEDEHRQQIIEIQREIERQAIGRRDESESNVNGSHMPPRLIDSNIVCEYRQHVIDMQREIEQQAIQRQDELRMHPNAPHMPPRLINSSTVRSSVFTIPDGGVIGFSNSCVNYPNAPLTPESDETKVLHFPDRSNYEDDGLPSYDEAVAFDSTTTSVTICRY